jgi:hypothetical protein
VDVGGQDRADRSQRHDRRTVGGRGTPGRASAGHAAGPALHAPRPVGRAPGQWAGLPSGGTGAGGGRPRPETLAVQVPAVVVETRPLAVYAALADETSRTSVANARNASAAAGAPALPVPAAAGGGRRPC